MLSRVANSLYWLSRYLERVEHTARVTDVNLVLMLDQVPASAEQRWEWLLRSLHLTWPAGKPVEPQEIVNTILFDRETPQSIIAMLGLARDNARQVRNQLSSEMWEHLNQLYLEVSQQRLHNIWDGQTHALFRRIKEGVQLFHGITEATMRRDEGWHFLQIGRYMERAEGTIVLLRTYYRERDASGTPGLDRDYLDLVGLLKSRTAFEAYCQVYTADLQPERIASFLLLSARFPHSVRFSAVQIDDAFQTINGLTHARNGAEINRRAGRLRSTLDYAQIEEIMGAGLITFLDDLGQQLAVLHQLLHETYFQPPIQAVVPW